MGRLGPAAIEYHGIAGSSLACQNAVVRLVQSEDAPVKARILSTGNLHGLLLFNDVGNQVAIKFGFSSGYGGTGPTCFSLVLQLLQTHNCDIDECEIDELTMERLNHSALTQCDIEAIETCKPILPSRWPDYIFQRHFEAARVGAAWKEFPPVIPYALIDERIFDLALSFWEDPDDKLLKAYRRLEDLIRERTGCEEHGAKLFTKAFHGDTSLLDWDVGNSSERTGRANLFVGTYLAYRNPRAPIANRAAMPPLIWQNSYC